MLLQCGMDGDAGEEARPTPAWLSAAALESLAELNEMSLALLAEQAAAAAAEPRSPLLREVSALWRTLDPLARRRAAAVPYLLLDGGFADRERWRHGAAPQVADSARAAGPAFFTVPGTIDVARLLFTYAWHLARAESAAARVLLGMPPGCAAVIAGCTLRRINALAERHPEWLRPRWAARAELWRELLVAAGSGEARALARARLHGLTMLAAEVRAAGLRAPLSGPAAAAAAAGGGCYSRRDTPLARASLLPRLAIGPTITAGAPRPKG